MIYFFFMWFSNTKKKKKKPVRAGRRDGFRNINSSCWRDDSFPKAGPLGGGVIHLHTPYLVILFYKLFTGTCVYRYKAILFL